MGRAALVSTIGCVVEVPESTYSLDDATLATAEGYHHFAHINSAPYASSVGAFDINLFANAGPDYSKVHPEQSGSGVTMAAGTVIVREVLASDGTVEKLTIMAKQSPGFDPTLGDWWFGEADPDGTPRELGRVTTCHGCHVPRAEDDFLFGVPAIDQAQSH